MANRTGHRGNFSAAQQKMAWQFACGEKGSPTMAHMGEALLWLDECFALMRGEMSEQEFRELTGHAPHGLRGKDGQQAQMQAAKQKAREKMNAKTNTSTLS